MSWKAPYHAPDFDEVRGEPRSAYGWRTRRGRQRPSSKPAAYATMSDSERAAWNMEMRAYMTKYGTKDRPEPERYELSAQHVRGGGGDVHVRAHVRRRPH